MKLKFKIELIRNKGGIMRPYITGSADLKDLTIVFVFIIAA